MIKPGDILCSYNNGCSDHRIISRAQKIVRGDSNIVHAAIALTATAIIEVGGSGIVETDLLEKQGTYDVFRCRDIVLQQNIYKAAKKLLHITDHARQRKSVNVSYNLGGAARSLFKGMKETDFEIFSKIYEDVNLYKDLSLFCSEFVVLCYQAALFEYGNASHIENPPLLKTGGSYSPAELHRKLKKHQNFFMFVGKSTHEYRTNQHHMGSGMFANRRHGQIF